MKIVIAGYGKFGRLALSRLSKLDSSDKIIVLDTESKNLVIPDGAEFSFHKTDVVNFLETVPDDEEDFLLIPTAPFHIAAAYLSKVSTKLGFAEINHSLIENLPNVFILDQFNVCCSYSDFLCPDDCSESERCSVTGEIRLPLYEKLEGLGEPDSPVVVLRSHQCLPGVGGFYFSELKAITGKTESLDSFILATSCRCHAILTGFARKHENRL